MEQAIQEITVEDLAIRIQSAHAQVENAIRSSLKHALEAGELLTVAKKRVPRGDWLGYLKAKCGLKVRSAQGYMRLYAKVGSDAQRVAHLSLRDALRYLGTGSATSAGSKGKRRPAPSENAKAGVGISIQFKPEDVTLALDVWTAGYKTLALKVHPDTGGDKLQMQVLNRLHQEIEKQFLDAAPREAMAA